MPNFSRNRSGKAVGSTSTLAPRSNRISGGKSVQNNWAGVSTPNAPTSLSLSSVTTTAAIIAFTAPTDNGGAVITNYAHSTDGITFTALSPADAITPVTITGLSASTSYTLYLAAINEVGTGVSSSGLAVTTANPNPSSVDYLVIAGGAGGARTTGNFVGAGGGGAGGMLTGSQAVSSSMSVIIGAGGATQGSPNTRGNSGTASTFVSFAPVGGGGGGAYSTSNGLSGGSGGGGAYSLGTGGAATSGQGNAGATQIGIGDGGAGGGGKGSAGTGNSGNNGGAGGSGGASSVTGSSVTYAGGGGGTGAYGGTGGTAGSGGGGAGGQNADAGGAGTANTGGGGGAGGSYSAGSGNGGAGGKGVVIISYANTFADPTIGGGLSYARTTPSGLVVYTFTDGSDTIGWS